ncbi:MAG: MerR family transcriptional regulator, partial [Microbacteriaceae bacterium]|nr:MerR family transcriptional regulator [Microbacteriaceae bacterium]
MPREATQPRLLGVAPLLSIGQVLARLTTEFPDLTPSKLRFLEERQLISPARTESGYRKFSPWDLDRLRFVLTMQRDHYLPLKVIRGYLVGLDAGRPPALPGGSTLASPSMLSAERRMSRDELVREAGATPQLLNDAV